MARRAHATHEWMLRLARIARNMMAVGLTLGSAACREGEHHEAARATANAEHVASEGRLTSAMVERPETPADTERARGEIVAAFQLEQADYRARLQRSVDALEADVARSKQPAARRAETEARRSRLKADLEEVDRCTEPDWAILRTKVERHLGGE